MIIYSGSKKIQTSLDPYTGLFSVPCKRHAQPMLILPTSEFTIAFEQALVRGEFGRMDEDRLIVDLLDAMSYDNDAEIMLNVTAWEIAHDHHYDRMEELGRVILALGEGLLHQIRMLKLYEQGLLHYQFARWHNADIMVRYGL